MIIRKADSDCLAFALPSGGYYGGITMKAPRHRGWRKNRTREKNGVFEMPDKEWLEHQFITLLKAQRTIAREVGCAKHTVATWCEKLGVHKTTSQAHTKYGRLDKAWLEQKCLQEGLQVQQVAAEVGCTTAIVYHWLREYGLASRIRVLYGDRRMDENSRNWRGGVSQQYQKAKLLRDGRKMECEWCGSEGDSRHIHMHHIDHDHENHDPSNLLLLCYHCNLLEAQLNRLREKGLATFIVEPGERIEVRFIRQSLKASA